MADDPLKQRQNVELDAQLARNGLVKRPLAEGPRSLFRAVSDYLYFHSNYSDQLVLLCQSTLERCVYNQSLPPKLAALFSNRPQEVSDYKANPHLHGFQKVHMELLSIAYERRIRIYSLTDHYFLSCMIVGARCPKGQITLCRVGNHYSAVVETQLQQIGDYLKSQLLKVISIKTKKLMVDEDPVPIEQVEPSPPVRHHKKSMSACDEEQYKQIFGQPKEFVDRPHRHPTLQRIHSMEQEDDELVLIRQCSSQFPKRSTAEDYFDLRYRMPYQLRIDPRFNERIISFQSQPLIAPTTPTMPPRQRPRVQYDQTKQPDNTKRYSGRLKFFDENKNYGFIVMDEDNTDIFVHYDDLHKAGMSKEFMRTTKQGNIIRFSFLCMNYIGKYDKSRKAVELISEDQYPMHV